MERKVALNVEMKEVLKFVADNFGDVHIISMERKNQDVKVVWKENKKDDDKYFSIIGRSNYGKLIEKIGGEA